MTKFLLVGNDEVFIRVDDEVFIGVYWSDVEVFIGDDEVFIGW